MEARAMKLREGTLKRVHVNQHVIRANGKTGARAATLTVKAHGRNYRSNRVMIDGPSELVYSPDKPLSCGAKVWIETTAGVSLDSNPRDV
jgi:hypothetical protein